MNDEPDRPSSTPYLKGVPTSPQGNSRTGHLHGIFIETVHSVHRYIPLRRAVLVAVGDHYRDLLAVAGWSQEQHEGTKLLSLHLPVEDSLFAHVAAQRFEFRDDYFGLFSGTSIERRLLLDDIIGGSYIISPIKVDSGLVGLIGFASALPGAFGDFEALDPERTFSPLAVELSRLRRESAR